MNKKYIIFSALFVIILGLSFYWFEFRPSNVRMECNKKSVQILKDAVKENVESDDLFKTEEFFYNTCIRAKGLKE